MLGSLAYLLAPVGDLVFSLNHIRVTYSRARLSDLNPGFCCFDFAWQVGMPFTLTKLLEFVTFDNQRPVHRRN